MASSLEMKASKMETGENMLDLLENIVVKRDCMRAKLASSLEKLVSIWGSLASKMDLLASMMAKSASNSVMLENSSETLASSLDLSDCSSAM